MHVRVLLKLVDRFSKSILNWDNIAPFGRLNGASNERRIVGMPYTNLTRVHVLHETYVLGPYLPFWESKKESCG